MAIVKPFRGIRFDLEKVGADLSALACPPYDIVPLSWQRQLYQRHPSNFIRVDLNQSEPGDDPDSVYRRAGEIWDKWLSEGALKRDGKPCFYLYRQAFTATVGACAPGCGISASRSRSSPRRAAATTPSDGIPTTAVQDPAPEAADTSDSSSAVDPSTATTRPRRSPSGSS